MFKAKFIFVLAFLLCTSKAFAQLSAAAYNKEDMETFFTTKMFFVLTADKKFNDETIAGLKEYWKHTKFDTMSEANFEKNVENTAYSFLTIIKIEVITEKKNANGLVISRTSDYYHYFGIINGGKKKIERFVYTDMIAYCPLNFYMDENPMYMSGFRAQSMVYQLHTAIQLVKDNELKGNSYKIVTQLQDIYNENAGVIKTKTLLVNKEHLIDITEEEFKAAYPFKVEFCTKEKFQKAYTDKDKKYALFQPTVTMNKSIFVYDAETYKCLYFGFDMISRKMKKGDLKDMVKAINGE
jgi:hypothetical protein